MKGTAERKDDFRADPSISTGSASLDDYKGSGYDRGHQKPAYHSKASVEEMSASFLMCNISPQNPSFNRGLNSRDEAQIAKWAEKWDGIYVVVGAVLSDGLPTIGTNEVSVPEYYYKIAFDITEPSYKMIAILLKNEHSQADLATFTVPVDSIETLTGIDFFPSLPDSLEEQCRFTNW